MKKSFSLDSMFNEFLKIPKGILIDRPDELVPTGFGAEQIGVFFTRRTLKHLAEKGAEGKRLLKSIPDIFRYPDLVLKGKNDRMLFIRFFPRQKGEPHVVVVEPNDGNVLVITSFITDQKYLKNFEILWRTGTSLS